MDERLKNSLRFLRNYLGSSEARYCVHRSLFPAGASRESDTLEGLRRHIDAGIGWILNAQSLQPDGGVTAYFLYGRRKLVKTSYPEVTGYIITTMVDYYKRFGGDHVLESARRMMEFELAQQLETGAFPGGNVGEGGGPSVFNSAQIVNGLVSYYRQTKDERALEAARRACDWIVSVQEPGGVWKKFNCGGTVRVQDTKVDQSLLELYQVTGDRALAAAAERHLEAALGEQRSNGWFSECDNSDRFLHVPLVHTIGYGIQGLIESYQVLGDDRLLAAARRASDPLIARVMENDRLLEGRFDSEWRPAVSSADVVGDSQLAVCWQHISSITGDPSYREAAFKMNRLLKAVQFMDGPKDLRGAVPSSFPFWGVHVGWGVTSWGVKFYTDSVMWEHELRSRQSEEGCPPN